MTADLSSLRGLSFEGDDGLQALCDVLERGELGPLAQRLLARAIRPDSLVDGFVGGRFVFVRERRTRPPKKPNLQLTQFLERHIDMFGEKRTAVVVAAMSKFGVGKTTCDRALRSARHKRDAELFALRKEAAMTFRAHGDSEFAPLR